MYSDTRYSIKTNQGYIESFSSNSGVKQGCNLSPLLFNIYINDLSASLYSDPVCLENSYFNSLLFADDIVIVSNSKNGLQNSLDKLHDYCVTWKLNVNINKTKVIIFNKTGKLIENDFYLGCEQINVVSSYNYLGIIFQSSGNFTLAINHLVRKAQRALGALKQTLNLNNCTLCPKNALQLFKSTVLPILMYGSEVWGAFTFKLHKSTQSGEMSKDLFMKKLFNDRSLFEQLHIKFCKQILGVHQKSSNVAVRAELGSYPIITEMCTQMLTFITRIEKKDCSELVHCALLSENKIKGNSSSSFLNKVKDITEDGDTVALDMLNARTKLKQIYMDEIYLPTLQKLNSNKLRTYNTIKLSHCFEPYLNLVTNIHHRISITKFRISAHTLPIERLRYQGIPPEERLCTLCSDQTICNEIHALLECNCLEIKKSRVEFLRSISIYDEDILKLSKQEMFEKIMSSSDGFIVGSLGKFVNTILKYNKL